MLPFENTRLWSQTLNAADSPESSDVAERTRLRDAYFRFRERAAVLARQIEHDLPDFTVHDATHLDSLWRLADLIGGPQLTLTPAEGFVLGGAILLHDLGMSLAAYAHGIDDLRTHAMWSDTVAAVLRERLGRTPKRDEIANADSEAERIATQRLLRDLHAERADQLAFVSWRDSETGEEYHLLEDPELRSAYGTVIGSIAHSHWLPVSDLADQFATVIGPPGILPSDWVVDPLKLACLLRTADAAHLDERRAPRFLRTLKNPFGIAAQHWSFQAKLNQPTLESGRLLFTANTPFGPDEANAWWLCFDALRTVDRELRDVDDLFADLGRQRFAATGVKGVDNANRLALLVPTRDWLPIDAQVKITDVQALIRNLGGESLYGDNQTIPLRELIQNAADAVRARRLIESRAADWGEVTITLGHDDHGDWIEVADTGVGMSTEALSGALLDFGKSGWNSGLILKSFPTLLSRGFESTGRYGIGFFSVFMWGDRVCVTSRRYDAALRDTHQLEFSAGLDTRPLLKRTSPSHCLRDGGTSVRVWLRRSATDVGGLLDSHRGQRRSLSELCSWLAPSLDINLYVVTADSARALVVAANDWRQIDGGRLQNRIWSEESSEPLPYWFDALVGMNLREVYDDEGTCVGRACILPELQYHDVRPFPGLVTVGGLRSGAMLAHMYGIMLGRSLTASRLAAKPEAHGAGLAKWSSEQADLLAVSTQLSPSQKAQCAGIVRVCGGYMESLPIAETSSGWVSVGDIAAMDDLPNEVILFQDAAYHNMKSNLGRDDRPEINLVPGVIAVGMGWPGIMQGRQVDDHWILWPNTQAASEWGDWWSFHRFTLVGAVIEALARAWRVSLTDILECSLKSGDDTSYERDVVVLPDGETKQDRVHIIRNPKAQPNKSMNRHKQ